MIYCRIETYDSHFDLDIQISFSRITQSSGILFVKDKYKHIKINLMKQNDNYYEFIAKNHFELGLHNGKSSFSISFLEALNQGLKPLFYSNDFYREIFTGVNYSDMFSFDKYEPEILATKMYELAKRVNVMNFDYDLRNQLKDKFEAIYLKQIELVKNKFIESWNSLSDKHAESQLNELELNNQLPDVLTLQDFDNILSQGKSTREYNKIAKNLVFNHKYREIITPKKVFYVKKDLKLLDSY